MIRICLTAMMCLALGGHALAAPPAHSDSIKIEGGIDHPRMLTAADLEKEPQTSVTISQHTGHGTLSGSFTGVSLWTLLQEAGVTMDSTKKNDELEAKIIKQVCVFLAPAGQGGIDASICPGGVLLQRQQPAEG